MKDINIPKFLQELHGKKASATSLLLVYANALLMASLILYLIIPADLSVWKSILLFVLVADIAGGAIANFTFSTRQYYMDNTSLQLPFLSLHIIHPILLFVIFPQLLWFSVFMGLFTYVAVIIVRLLAQNQDLKIIAVLLVIIGSTITLLIPCHFEILKIIPILFFLKLILGFALGVFRKKDEVYE